MPQQRGLQRKRRRGKKGDPLPQWGFPPLDGSSLHQGAKRSHPGFLRNRTSLPQWGAPTTQELSHCYPAWGPGLPPTTGVLPFAQGWGPQLPCAGQGPWFPPVPLCTDPHTGALATYSGGSSGGRSCAAAFGPPGSAPLWDPPCTAPCAEWGLTEVCGGKLEAQAAACSSKASVLAKTFCPLPVP